MDAFERARLKHAKNLERKERSQESAVESPKAPDPVPTVVLRTKPTHEAIVEVKLTHPDGEVVVVMMKPHIYANANKSRLNKSEIKRCVENGFRPLLGGLLDVPGSGK